MFCLGVWAGARSVSHNLSLDSPRLVRRIAVSRKRKVIDSGSYLFFDLVDLYLLFSFIRGIRRGFVLSVTQILLQQGHRETCGKELFVQILILSE